MINNMLSNDLTTFMLQTARRSDMHTKYVCIVTHKGKVISTGYNYYKTSACFKNNPCLLRA
jgi:deoxycytidylate deaminase